MNHKKLFIRGGIILFVLSLTIAVYAVISRTDTKSPKIQTIVPLVVEPYTQAAKFIDYETPFYFPFKARNTNMAGLTPFAQQIGTLVRHNSHGFRTPEYTIAHPPNTFRILVIGDSLTSGIGTPLEEGYPNALSKLMNGECAKFRTEVIALGVNGHRLADNLIKLLIHGQYLKPDLVIIQLSHEDLNFYDYFMIYYLRGLKDPYAAYSKKEMEILNENSVDWRVFHESLEEIRKWSQKTSVPVAYLVFPPMDGDRSGRNFRHYDPQNNYVAGILMPFQKVLPEIESYGLPTLNLLETFRNEDEYLVVSPGVRDLNPYGHRLVAKSLSSFLFRQNLVNCDQAKIRGADPTWERENKLRQYASQNWTELNASNSRQVGFFEDLHAIYPGDPWITSLLAEKYRSIRQWRLAFTTYESLQELAPNLAAPWFNMSDCTRNNSHKLLLLKKMVEVLPDHTDATLSLATLYMNKNRKEEACKLLQHVMEISRHQEQYDNSKKLFDENKCQSTI